MKYLIKKIGILIITLLFVSIIAFLAFQVIPGDPVTAMLGTDATPEREAQLRENLGLNDPLGVQYINWIGNFLQGDFGESYSYGVPVNELLTDKLPVTVTLAFLSLLLILVISVPIGILSARFGKRWAGHGFDFINQTFMAVPSFFLGILIVLVFGLILKWFTPGQYTGYRENIVSFTICLLPAAFSIAIPKSAMVIKFIKNGIQKEMGKDYVRTAFSKGNTTGNVLLRHVLKNALIPVITLLGMIAADTLAGSIVVEQVFNLPGMGRLLISSIGSRDFPVVQVIVLYIAAMVILINFLVDVVYRIIDPRISGIE